MKTKVKPNRAICRTCSDCGSEFTISSKFQKYVEENGLKLPKRCKKCRDLRKKPYRIKTCIECSSEFTITQNEHKFYAERGLTEPKRCPNCRQDKKYERNTEKAKQE